MPLGVSWKLRQPQWIRKRPRIIPDIRIRIPQVCRVAPVADGVGGDEAADEGVHVAEAVVVEAGLAVVVAGLEEVGVAQGRLAGWAAPGRVVDRGRAVGVVNVTLHDSPGGRGQGDDVTPRVLEVEVGRRGRARARVVGGHGDHAVRGLAAEQVAPEELVGAVPLLDYVPPGVDIADGVASGGLGDPAPKGVVGVGGYDIVQVAIRDQAVILIVDIGMAAARVCAGTEAFAVAIRIHHFVPGRVRGTGDIFHIILVDMGEGRRRLSPRNDGLDLRVSAQGKVTSQWCQAGLPSRKKV